MQKAMCAITRTRFWLRHFIGLFTGLGLAWAFSGCAVKRPATVPPHPLPENPPILERDTIADSAEAMDTLHLKVLDTVQAPVLVRDHPKAPPSGIPEESATHIYRDQYRITVCLPFLADSVGGTPNRVAQWSRDFYLGFKLAFDRLPASGPQFRIRTKDTRADAELVNRWIGQGELDDADVIVGPFRTNQVAAVADFVATRPILQISPYTASSRIGKGNPHYLQMNPSLESHLATIWAFLNRPSDDGSPVIFFLGKGDGEQAKRILWQSWIDSLPKSRQSRFTFNVINEKGDMAMEDLLVDSLFRVDQLTNVVFPFWDETLVQAIMSKISSGITTRSIRLFGLPQWTGFDRISPSYFENLDVHISSVDYLDNEDPWTRELRRKYMASYADPLTTEAAWGYRCGQYLIRRLTKEGALFQRFADPERLLAGQDLWFDPERDALGQIVHMENRRIRILRFENGRLVPVD